MKLQLRFTILTSFLLLASVLYASDTGKIAGKVTDAQTGESLPFANVIIEGTTMGAATDIEGNYVILNVSPGVYTLTASLIGYQKVTVTDVRVNVDFTTRINFELEAGSIDLPAVIVQGERNPLIREDLTNPTVAITAESIEELPVDQISDIIALQAGVTVGDDGDLHLRGGFANEVAYTLNGVSLNDPYGNRRSIGLATNAVQEVSTSIGTFTAQYGNALSGVVNYVTKEGGNDYSFSLRGYAGEYVSSRDDLFQNIDDIDPLNRKRLEATVGGPIPFSGNKLKFFLSGVYEKFEGSRYGQRLYLPTDSYLSREQFTDDTYPDRVGQSSDPYFFNPYDPESDGTASGDNEWVSMNESESFNFQGNLSYQISSLFKIKAEGVYNKSEYMPGYLNNVNVYRQYKYNPDGLGMYHDDGYFVSFDVTHTINQYAFYTLKGSYGVNSSEYYLYEDVDDPRYLPSDIYGLEVGITDFAAGGTSNYRLDRETKTTTVKGDLEAQLFGSHELKFGFEGRFHDLYFEDYNVQVRKAADSSQVNNRDLLDNPNLPLVRFKPTEPSLMTNYRKYPVDAAVYVQDKIELAKTLILNVGLRYEYFDPKATYNPNLTDDLQDIQQGFITRSNEAAEAKHHLSPRISVSYPITAEGIIRLSYGHFYQNGSLSNLYSNPNFFALRSTQDPQFGNPNVNMQKAVQYEVGLQQGLTEDIKFDLTGYYKDIRDYIFFQDVFTPTGRQYTVLTNLAYGNVRGITFRLEKRKTPEDFFYASLDYTFQIAEGNRTEPSEDLFFSEEAGKQTETFLVPLSFDRQHDIKGNFVLDFDDWVASFTGYFRTGTPYTPSFPSSINPITFEQRSGTKPIQWNVDLKLEKFFEMGDFTYSLFLQVDNLFDTENELSVYSSTGRALSSIEEEINAVQFTDIRNRIERGDAGLFGINEIDGYYSLRPERVNRPREIRLGFSLMFN